MAARHLHWTSTFPMQEFQCTMTLYVEMNHMTCFYLNALPVMKQSCFYLITQQMKTKRNKSVEFSPLCIISQNNILFHLDTLYILNRHKCGR